MGNKKMFIILSYTANLLHYFLYFNPNFLTNLMVLNAIKQ